MRLGSPAPGERLTTRQLIATGVALLALNAYAIGNALSMDSVCSSERIASDGSAPALVNGGESEPGQSYHVGKVAVECATDLSAKEIK